MGCSTGGDVTGEDGYFVGELVGGSGSVDTGAGVETFVGDLVGGSV